MIQQEREDSHAHIFCVTAASPPLLHYMAMWQVMNMSFSVISEWKCIFGVYFHYQQNTFFKQMFANNVVSNHLNQKYRQEASVETELLPQNTEHNFKN